MLVDKTTGEIFIYEPIGADFFGEGITAENVILALDTLGGKRATVRINSPGGSVFDGVAIFNALKRYSGGVDTVVDSLAASIASVIALAGEKRTTATGSLWMVHRAMSVGIGNVNDMEKVVQMLKAGDKSIASIYQDATGLSEDEIIAKMDAETWFTADEAVAIGFATAKEGDAMKRPQAAAWFKNAPKAIWNTTDVVKPKVFVQRQAAAVYAKM